MTTSALTPRDHQVDAWATESRGLDDAAVHALGTTWGQLQTEWEQLPAVTFGSRRSSTRGPVAHHLRQRAREAGGVAWDLIRTSDALLWRIVLAFPAKTRKLAHKWGTRRLPLSDSISVAQEGLFEAALRYDIAHPVPFRSYCGPWVRVALQRASHRSYEVSASHTTKERVTQLLLEQDRRAARGLDSSPEAIVQDTGMHKGVLRALSMHYTLHLDAPRGGEACRPVPRALVAQDPSEELADHMDLQRYLQVVHALPTQYREELLAEAHGPSRMERAAALGVSRNAIWRRVEKAKAAAQRALASGAST